ncbi:MAG: hypothetical protein CR982_00665 [Candidatus Cloacimonadota bacterium]|nr:MAG: hypothetical protein CR982_00665 [Candidatus Cloacimonadota bacterium]PIE78443.1 MAG: hypothetical protein CSA15_07840 [Candidatus Delongbacteria bacterium]
MRKIIVLILIIIVSAVYSKSGFNFLKMEHSPVGISTAGTDYLFSPKGQAVNYNPAVLSLLDGTSFGVSYSSSVEDSYFTSSEINHNPGVGNISVIFNSYGIDDIDGYYKPSENPQYSFDAKTLVSGIGYGYKWNDNFSFGLSYKLIFEKIEFDEAWAHSFNGGVVYRDLIEGLVLSTHISNLGTSTRVEDTKENLPFSLNGGISYSHKINLVGVNFAVNNRYDFNDEKNFLNLGAEISWQSSFFLRVGYRPENEAQILSYGAGFKVYGLSVDYFYSQFDDIGDTQGFSVNYQLF